MNVDHGENYSENVTRLSIAYVFSMSSTVLDMPFFEVRLEFNC